jgi:ParB-like chromosome segregation protein Spo0J
VEVAMSETTEQPQIREHGFHPIANMFPLLEGPEFDDLVEDVRKHGQREPIVLFEKLVLDGRNRERACQKAGVEPRYHSIEFGDHDAAVAYVISANIRRRHLTAEQKRDLIVKLLKADPTKSDRQIAGIANVDHKTIAKTRNQAERRGEIPHVKNRSDTKGRKQPAKKPGKTAANTETTKVEGAKKSANAAWPRDDALFAFTERVLDLKRRISKHHVERFAKTAVGANDLAKIGKFFTDLARIKAEAI